MENNYILFICKYSKLVLLIHFKAFHISQTTLKRDIQELHYKQGEIVTQM